MLKETTCKHFNGIGNDCCKAGVNYRELAGEPEFGMALRLPCAGAWEDNPKFDPAKVVSCEKHEPPTAEEIASEREQVRARYARQAQLTSDGNEHHIWQCDRCEGFPQWETARGFVDHLVAAHGMTEPIQVRREMLAHLDARDWFQTNYALYLPDDTNTLIGHESHRDPRRGSNAAAWGSTPKGKKGKR
jgi:hypothetical protein